MVTDQHAINGKIPAADERFGVVVVGAGSAGTAAAIDAAKGGASVLLIDENPVRGDMIGTDVPLYFGGRMTAAVQSPQRMVEQLFATNPLLEQAFDAGVDVRLGTCAWGLYVNGPAMRTLPEPLLGIADSESATMIGFGRLLLATGARDVVLGFEGWTRPGVMGAQGFAMLLARYDALASRRILIIGGGELGRKTARLALERGLEVAGIVGLDEIEPVGDVPLLPHHSIAATEGGIDGVERAVLASLTGDGRSTIECDTIVLAIAAAPATELLDAAGVGPGGTIELIGDCATVPRPDPALLAAWSAALGRYASPATIVCQCEEVTRADLIGVQPPNYLDRPAPMAARSLASLLNDGPAHPDQIKRLTRAGMGACQGRRCREQVTCLLAAEQGTTPDRVPVASMRAPVRPIPLGILADWNERPEMAAGWDVWFGIPTQWLPYAVIGTPEEAELVANGGNMHV